MADGIDPEKLKGEIEVHTYRSSGPGGQKKNKTESAVRIRHIPTGVTAVATESRSQTRNRQTALARLVEKLEKRRRRRKKRIPTKVPKAVKKRTLESKRRRSRTKVLRKKVDGAEEG